MYRDRSSRKRILDPLDGGVKALTQTVVQLRRVEELVEVGLLPYCFCRVVHVLLN